MNAYYHEFSVGFNWWFVVGPLMVLMMAVIGSTRYALDDYSKRIRRRGKGFDVMVKMVAIVFDVLLHIMIFKESVTGLFQWLVNHVDGDPIWALILAPVVLTGTSAAVYCVLYTFARLGEWTKHGYLIDLRHDLLEEEKVEEKSQHQQCRQVEVVKPELPESEPEIERVEAEIVDSYWLDEDYDDSGWQYGPGYFDQWFFDQGFTNAYNTAYAGYNGYAGYGNGYAGYGQATY